MKSAPFGPKRLLQLTKTAPPGTAGLAPMPNGIPIGETEALLEFAA